jgi:hypothetical protein
MKAATINELKQELLNTPPAKVTELCLRLARFKKENKELLTYLLFEAHDTVTYIESIKTEMDEQFEGINKSNAYFVKKTLRKILRTANKYIRYCGLAAVEIELLIYFCNKVNNLDASLNKAIAALHEDLQYDYLKEVEKL